MINCLKYNVIVASSVLLCVSACATPVRADISGRIIGGTVAADGAWPWAAAMVQRGQNNIDGHICGGALIRSNVAATAAHCMDDGYTASDLAVVLGRNNLNNSGGEVINVSRILIHPNYESGAYETDLALLFLEEESSQALLTVIDQGDPSGLAAAGVTATAVGWGDTDGSGTYLPELRQVQLPIWSTADAQAVWGSSLTSTMLAAGLEEGGKDTCTGDSGGPLMVPDGSGWVLAGITSFGDGCAQANSPGVYTRVSVFRDWIDAQAGPLVIPVLSEMWFAALALLLAGACVAAARRRMVG